MLLEADHLVKRFGDFTAVQDLGIRVRAGEVFGLLGPNGAGKTTTTSMCIGLLHPTSGSVRIAGYDVVRDAQAVKALIGYAQDEPYLYDRLTARIHHLDGRTLRYAWAADRAGERLAGVFRPP